MSTFCGGKGNIPAMTIGEIAQPYSPPMGSTAFLPASMPTLNDDGFIDEGWLRQYIQSLQSSGILPTPPPLQNLEKNPSGAPDTVDPLAMYTQKMKGVAGRIKTEYCFYEKAYFASVDRFLQSVSDASLGTKGSGDVQPNLDAARVANQRVTVFTQVVNAISKYNYVQTQNWTTEINIMNGQFAKNAVALKEQADILNKSTAAADLNKRMISYTLEKNKANTNLLSLYTVLNASAIAMLIYISRSQ
jgi:hypothetical protein